MSSIFFFNDTATTEIYTLSLHDALPIYNGKGDDRRSERDRRGGARTGGGVWRPGCPGPDRKSTRLNSSHSQISYAVFCLKKKKTHALHSVVSVCLPAGTAAPSPTSQRPL